MLRRTGCTLPVELWFFEEELPTPGMASALAALDVMVRSLDELQPGASTSIFHDGADGFGYVMKAVVILFSSFEEILYLDSDNIAAQDPSSLFESPEYLRHGAVLWPDYWPPSAAPDLFEIIAPEAKPWEGAEPFSQHPPSRSEEGTVSSKTRWLSHHHCASLRNVKDLPPTPRVGPFHASRDGRDGPAPDQQEALLGRPPARSLPQPAGEPLLQSAHQLVRAPSIGLRHLPCFHACISVRPSRCCCP